jgi:hypothetical protein
MELRAFLEKVLPTSGFYCVFAVKGEDRKQKFYDSIGSVVDVSQNFDSGDYDTYFGLASFKDGTSRKGHNADKLRSFFLDLDCGPTKDYPDQASAIHALRSFCASINIQKPIIVNSGRGIHAYWPLSEDVPVDNWLPVAERLKNLCAQRKLYADPAVTSDVARVLRVPGTRNHKGAVPAAVHFFGENTTTPISLEVFAGHLGETIAPPPRKYVPSGSNAVSEVLMGNRTSSFRDILNKIREGSGCLQLRNIVVDQTGTPEPLWRAGLSIAKFCEDGERAAHLISHKHPEYSVENTLKKLELIKGPYRCATFDEYAPGICTGCQHWGKIKSPINLGSKIKEATEEDNVIEELPTDPGKPAVVYNIPAYPHPYFRGANGGVYVRKTQQDGSVDEVPIYHNDIYVVRRVRDPEIGEAVVLRLHLPRDGVREFTVPLTAVTSKDEFRKAMSSQGVATFRMDDLMKYTLDWVNELQGSDMADEAHKQFGWSDAEMTSFILGNQEIFADRIEFNPPSAQTAGLFSTLVCRGSMEEWKKHMEFYNRPGFELHQYIVGTAFGSVLMQLSPIKCAGLHIYSKESGVGKTTAMMAAASVWGNPEELLLIKQDTYNTKMHRSEIYHNLPLYIDELTDSKPHELSELAYQITGGRQRGRMQGSANIERYRGDPWHLLAVSTGNVSVLEKIRSAKAMPKAEAQRILEIKVDRIFKKSEDKAAQDIFSAGIVNNFGYAGLPYVQYVMKNLPAVRKLVIEVQHKVDAHAKLTSENRFWSAHVSHTLAGLILAKKVGLLNYPVDAVFKWAMDMLQQNGANVSEMNISAQEVLNDYINEHWSNVLWIKSTDDLRGKPSGALDNFIVPEALPRGKLVARYETDIKCAYLVPKPLRAWCAEQQINYTSLIQDLVRDMGAKRVKMRLSKGTHMQLPPVDVIMVNCLLGNADGDRGTESK